MDVPELLRSAVDLIPTHARSDAGLGADDVRDYLRYTEWEDVLGILEDFDGIQWQTARYWDLLSAAGEQMGLDNGAWIQWRRSECLHGLIRAHLTLVGSGAGGRGLPIPGKGALRSMWSFGPTTTADHADLHVARIWVESAPEIPPGGQGPIRLLPLTPADWRHLQPGAVITMHEQRSLAGTARIREIQHPQLRTPE